MDRFMCFEGGGAILKYLSKEKIDCYVLNIHVALGKGYGRQECRWCY